MKKLVSAFAALTLALPAFAGAATGHGSGHGASGAKSQAAGAQGHGGAAHGKELRTAKVDGYRLSYRLLDMKEHMQAMEGKMDMKHADMSKMKSHHVMVYIQTADGKSVDNAKVGFQVTGPKQEDQKTMAVSHDGGYGADVDLAAKGEHKLKLKAIVGDKTLVDEFGHTVK